MKTVNLRLWIPGIVFIFTTVLIIGMFFYQTTVQTANLKQQKTANVTYTMIRLQRFIEEALNHHDDYLIEQEISGLGLESEVETLALINPDKKVQYATRYAWKNKYIFNVSPQFKTELFPLTITSKPIIELSENTSIITAYFPVHYPQINNIRSTSYGILYIRYDISQLLAAIYDTVLAESGLLWGICILLMFILTLVLKKLINHPIKHLIQVMDEFSYNTNVKANLTGKGELAILGHSFNQLTENLLTFKTQLTKQRNLYSLLSATNKLLIRVQSQEQLFNDVCTIAVKKPSLVLAWIGLINQQTQSVDILAKSGSALAYLDSLTISLNPTLAEGQGPSAIAIRENRNLVVNNFCKSPLTKPWQQAAEKSKICASAAFPICKFKQVIGVFVLYANRVDYFTDDVISLLDEMTKDISFALEKIELEQLKQQAEEQLRDREERLAITLNSIGDAVIVTDTKGRITRMNPVAENMTGWHFSQAEGVVLSDVFCIVNAQTQEIVENPVEKVIREGVIVGLANHTVLISKQGKAFQIADSAAPIRDKNNSIIGVILVFQDVTKQYMTYSALQLSEERFRSVTEASGAYIWELDRQLTYCYLTERVQAVKGYTVMQLLGKSIFDTILETDIPHVTHILNKAIAKKSNFELTFQNKTSKNEILWEEMKGQVVLDKNGEFIKLRGAGVSINERKHAEAQITQLAYYDALTNLPNRRLLSEQLDKAFIAAKQHGQFGALLFLDLDQFKHINDSLGHEIGDELLTQVAIRLKIHLRQEDIVARLGGDEFVILLVNLSNSLEIAIHLARKITEQILITLREPYLLKQHIYHNNASVGVTLFPLKEQNVTHVLKQADTALYRAKDNGRNNFQFYRSEMQEAADKRLEIEKNLRSAIRLEQFSLSYQPQFNHLKQITGAEILLRWNVPELGFVSPAKFIPIAEEAGLIVEIGYWIFRESFLQIKTWLETGVLKQDQHISINISSKQFKEVDFFQKLTELVAETQVNASVIILELTESVFLKNIDHTIEKMLQLRSLGFTFSIDDFGTGYSSLAYLKRLPLNELKIDKAFVDDIEHDDNDKVIVETIISMARHLRLRVIAEGVETEAQLDFLKTQGCFHYQGYLFSKPLDSKTFENYMRQHI